MLAESPWKCPAALSGSSLAPEKPLGICRASCDWYEERNEKKGKLDAGKARGGDEEDL